MAKQKNLENAPQLPLQYSKDNKQEKTSRPQLPKEDAKMKKDIRRIESISNAVYGKPRSKTTHEQKTSTTDSSGELLLANYKKLKKWRENYLETRQIPPEFNTSDEKKEEFLKLIGWK
jgi:hypothetical protein